MNKKTYSDLTHEEKQDLVEKYPYKTDAELFKETAVHTNAELSSFIDDMFEEEGILMDKSSLDVIRDDEGGISTLGTILSGLDSDMAKLALEMRKGNLDPIDELDDATIIQKIRLRFWLEQEFNGIPDAAEITQGILQHITQIASQKHKIKEGLKLHGNIKHTLVGLIDEIDEMDDKDDYIDITEED